MQLLAQNVSKFFVVRLKDINFCAKLMGLPSSPTNGINASIDATDATPLFWFQKTSKASLYSLNTGLRNNSLVIFLNPKNRYGKCMQDSSKLLLDNQSSLFSNMDCVNQAI